MKFCVIPIRFKSQRLQKKNYKDVFGLKLNSITISQAIGSGIFDKIIVAVDEDHEYDDMIKLPDNVEIYKRNPTNSSPDSSLESIITEVINVFSVDPGQVKTKMNPYGLLATDQVALKIINLLKFGNELHGKFIDLNKNILSW